MMASNVLIVIPAFNEGHSIGEIIVGLRNEVPDYDRVVVNDGSKDGMTLILDQMGENQLKLPVNLGYGFALQTGLKYAVRRGYEIVVTMDADGQHRPRDVPDLVKALLEHHADVVIGSRYSDGRPYRGPAGRRIGQRLFSLLSRIGGGPRIYDTTSGFKAFNARACRAMSSGVFQDFHVETIVRLGLLGYSVVEHPVHMNERVYGKSMHSFANAWRYPFKTLVIMAATTFDALLTRRRP